MTRRSKKRKRRRRNWLDARLKAMEYARGHDGFLRGKPEPVLLLGAYGVGKGEARLLHRSLLRFTVQDPFPSSSTLEHEQLFNLALPPELHRVVLLGIAMELDSGQGVQAVYAALSDHHLLSVWQQGASLPEPLKLEEMTQAAPTSPPQAVPVHVQRDGVDLSDACTKDDWVAAGMLLLDTNTSSSFLWRMRFCSDCGRNDWTAVIKLRLVA